MKKGKQKRSVNKSKKGSYFGLWGAEKKKVQEKKPEMMART